MEDLQELVQKVANNSYLVFQSGLELGKRWIELQGDGVKELKKLIHLYGKNGKKGFNNAFGLIIKERLEKELEKLEEQKQELLKKCPPGAPYTERGITEMLATWHQPGMEGIEASKKLNEIFSLESNYQNFLETYRSGRAIEIYIEPKVHNFRGKSMPQYRGRIPKGGIKITLQKEK